MIIKIKKRTENEKLEKIGTILYFLLSVKTVTKNHLSTERNCFHPFDHCVKIKLVFPARKSKSSSNIKRKHTLRMNGLVSLSVGQPNDTKFLVQIKDAILNKFEEFRFTMGRVT